MHGLVLKLSRQARKGFFEKKSEIREGTKGKKQVADLEMQCIFCIPIHLIHVGAQFKGLCTSNELGIQKVLCRMSATFHLVLPFLIPLVFFLNKNIS